MKSTYKAQMSVNNDTHYIEPPTFTNKSVAIKHVREAAIAELFCDSYAEVVVWRDDGEPFHVDFTPEKTVYRRRFYKTMSGKVITK